MEVEVRRNRKILKTINRQVDTLKCGSVLTPFVTYNGKYYKLCYETPKGKRFIKL